MMSKDDYKELLDVAKSEVSLGVMFELWENLSAHDKREFLDAVEPQVEYADDGSIGITRREVK